MLLVAPLKARQRKPLEGMRADNATRVRAFMGREEQGHEIVHDPRLEAHDIWPLYFASGARQNAPILVSGRPTANPMGSDVSPARAGRASGMIDGA